MTEAVAKALAIAAEAERDGFPTKARAWRAIARFREQEGINQIKSVKNKPNTSFNQMVTNSIKEIMQNEGIR